MTHGRGIEGETGKWSEYPVPFTLPRNMVYPALLPLMRTPRLPVVDWTDAPADLNGLVLCAERRNLVWVLGYLEGSTRLHFLRMSNIFFTAVKWTKIPWSPSPWPIHYADLAVLASSSPNYDMNIELKINFQPSLTRRGRKQMDIFERKVYRRIIGLVYDSEKENWRILTNNEIYAMVNKPL